MPNILNRYYALIPHIINGQLNKIGVSNDLSNKSALIIALNNIKFLMQIFIFNWL